MTEKAFEAWLKQHTEKPLPPASHRGRKSKTQGVDWMAVLEGKEEAPA